MINEIVWINCLDTSFLLWFNFPFSFGFCWLALLGFSHSHPLWIDSHENLTQISLMNCCSLAPAQNSIFMSSFLLKKSLCTFHLSLECQLECWSLVFLYFSERMERMKAVGVPLQGPDILTLLHKWFHFVKQISSCSVSFIIFLGFVRVE